MSYFDYSPRTHDLAGMDPPGGIFDAPAMVVVINERYVPFVVGVLEVLAQDEYWENPAVPVQGIEQMIAGLGQTFAQLRYDHRSGIWRPSGCDAVVSAVGGAVTGVWYAGVAGNTRLVIVAPGAAGQQGVSVTFTDADDAYTPSAVFTAQCSAADANGSTLPVYDLNCHYLNPAEDVNLSGVVPTGYLVNKEIRDFTITKDGGGFWLLLSMVGPNLL